MLVRETELLLREGKGSIVHPGRRCPENIGDGSQKGAKLLGTISCSQIARQCTINEKARVRVVTAFQSFLQWKTCSLYSVVQFAFAV